MLCILKILIFLFIQELVTDSAITLDKTVVTKIRMQLFNQVLTSFNI